MLLVFLGLLLLPAILSSVRSSSFETRRWAESNLQEDA
jgi:hypothetical protein